jgi:hypothetical protein
MLKFCRVIGVDRVYYIMAYVLECPNTKCEHRKRYTTSPVVMQQYPQYLQESFPAMLTNCAAIDHKVYSSLFNLKLLKMLETAATDLQGPFRTRKMIVALHFSEYVNRWTRYLSFAQ